MPITAKDFSNVPELSGFNIRSLSTRENYCAVDALPPFNSYQQNWVQRSFIKDAILPYDPVWNEKLDGYITIDGIKLKSSEKARSLFSDQINLFRELIDAGTITLNTQWSIWDADNIEHKLTVGEVKELLAQYGIAWYQMYVKYAP